MDPILAHERFLSFAGQPCARLSMDQAIYHESSDRSGSLHIFAFFSFMSFRAVNKSKKVCFVSDLIYHNIDFPV
jgi:hypothetical protein